MKINLTLAKNCTFDRPGPVRFPRTFNEFKNSWRRANKTGNPFITFNGVTFFINPVLGEESFYIEACPTETRVVSSPFPDLSFLSQQDAIEFVSLQLACLDERRKLIDRIKNARAEEEEW